MFENMPDNPLPRAFAKDSLLFLAQEGWAWENLPNISGSTGGKGRGKCVGGGRKGGNQVGGLKRGLLLFVCRVPVRDVGKIGIPFAHPQLEPPDTVGNDMLRNHPDRPVVMQ